MRLTFTRRYAIFSMTQRVVDYGILPGQGKKFTGHLELICQSDGGDKMESKTGASNKTAANEKEVSPLLEGVRKVLLAGLGAAALAQDELEDFVKKLVERGEIAEKDAKKLIQETRAKRRKRGGTAEDQISRRMEELLERLNVPTKHDFKTLSDKINALSRKVDELKKTQG